jgi:magnesium-transporting ATPase (P-type)
MRLLAPLLDTMTLVLLAAALVSGLIGDLADTVVIAVIVVLNTVISAVQEWQADQALAALQRLATHDAQVRRDGQVGPVPADQLVPGDVVLLEAGDQVPADLRLHQVAQLRTDESALTGESQAVDKQPAALPPPGRARPMRWANAATWPGRAPWSPTGGPPAWWWPPAPARSWAASPACWPRPSAAARPCSSG